MGEVLIAGMAAMLICIFLGPKFIEYLRVKEFGQHIREDGPQEHHAKAGTPTMGGLIVFASICVPYLVLSDRDAQSLAVFGVAMGCAAIGFADDFIKIVKRRSLGLSARWKILFQIFLALRPLVGRPPRGRARADPLLPHRRRQPRPRPGPLLRPRLPRHRRHLQRGQPHRRPRRPRRRLLRDRPARLHGDLPSSPTSSRTWRCSPPAWSAPASASSGSTPSRPRSSWGTPARSGSAARSARSR